MGGLAGLGVGGGGNQTIYSGGVGGSAVGSVIGTSKKQNILGETKPNGNLMLYWWDIEYFVPSYYVVGN